MSCENGIPGGAASTSTPAGTMAASGNYPSIKPKASTASNGEEVVRVMLENGYPIEFAIGLAGVFAAESEINPAAYNNEEKANGFSYRDKHAPDAQTFTYKGQKYYMDQANMMKFGYGKGIAQWSWSRNLSFRDWYNGSGGSQYRRGGPSSIDTDAEDIIKTTLAAQTGFALYELNQRSGKLRQAIQEIRDNHTTPSQDEQKFKANITKAVDAALRGFENGTETAMASVSAIDKYKWAGGYEGSMKTRVGKAMGLYESFKKNGKFPEYLS